MMMMIIIIIIITIIIIIIIKIVNMYHALIPSKHSGYRLNTLGKSSVC